jgi:glycerol-3-phosphate O-acyltransferase
MKRLLLLASLAILGCSSAPDEEDDQSVLLDSAKAPMEKAESVEFAMNVAGFLLRPLYWLAGKIFAIWARPAIQPEAPSELVSNPDAAVCYVLETGGLADMLALERACKIHGMPSPSESFKCCDRRESRRVVVMRRTTGLMFRRSSPKGSPRLRRLVEAADAKQQELLLIPVAIYWGRSPQKERSVFKLLFAENWDVAGRTRKFFSTLLLGRNTLLRFSEPLPLSFANPAGAFPAAAYGYRRT